LSPPAKEIAAALGVSEITVKAHRGQVMRKMGAHSLADLIRMADKLREAAYVLEYPHQSIGTPVRTCNGPRAKRLICRVVDRMFAGAVLSRRKEDGS
jgi:Bacterial regulatory proteins, luxR family